MLRAKTTARRAPRVCRLSARNSPGAARRARPREPAELARGLSTRAAAWLGLASRRRARVPVAQLGHKPLRKTIRADTGSPPRWPRV
jgi:hypothetical protein